MRWSWLVVGLWGAGMLVGCGGAPPPVEWAALQPPRQAPARVVQHYVWEAQVGALARVLGLETAHMGQLDWPCRVVFEEAGARVTMTQAFDAAGRLATQRAAVQVRGEVRPMVASRFEYDAAGRLARVVREVGEQGLREERALTYDAAGRLVAERVAQADGQVLVRAFSPEAARALRWRARVEGEESDGEPRGVEVSEGGRWVLAARWGDELMRGEVRGELLARSVRPAMGLAPSVTRRFEYDGQGRVVTSEEAVARSGRSAVTRRTYRYAGARRRLTEVVARARGPRGVEVRRAWQLEYGACPVAAPDGEQKTK